VTSLREQHEALEAQMAAIRRRAVDESRKLTAGEAEQLNDLSVERASVYRAWQQERLRTEPSNIIAGADIFKQSARKRQWQRWALVLVAAVILGVMRYERYNDRQATGSNYTPSQAQTWATETITEEQQALFNLLPPVSALPDGFETGGEWTESLDDLAWEDNERRLQLIAWGFEDAVFRYYLLPDETLSTGAGGLYDLDVELVEYGSREQALEAAEYDYSEAVKVADENARTMSAVDEPIVGDLAAAISEPFVTYGVELRQVTLWIVDGPFQYKFWSISDDPAVPPPALIEIARETVALN
jgi:hypothetical protein